MSIPDDIDLQHTWIHSEIIQPGSFPNLQSIVDEMLSQNLLVPAMSYTRFMPPAIKLTYLKLEIGAELISVPDGTVLNRLNPNLLPKAGHEIQSSFYPLQGTLDKDYEKTYTGQDVFSEPLKNTNILLLYIMTPDKTTGVNTVFGGKYCLCALVKENHLKLIYEHPQPIELIYRYLPYMEPPSGRGVGVIKPGLEKDSIKSILKLLRV